MYKDCGMPRRFLFYKWEFYNFSFELLVAYIN